jgi:hypothetical protein
MTTPALHPDRNRNFHHLRGRYQATRGGGPPYAKFGARALYRWRDALDWARSRTTAPRRSTAEGDATRERAAPDADRAA